MADFLYCLNSSTIKPTPILEKIVVAAEAGYSGIELWHDDIDLHLAQGGQLSDIRKALEDQDLTVPTTIMLKGWCDTTGEEHSRALDECKRRMDQAVEVGAIYSIAGPTHAKVDRNLAIRNYRELLEIGIKRGIKPAMEYLGFAEQINTIDDALEIVEGSGFSEATLVLDPFHCFRGSGGMEPIGELQENQIAISHFNDAPADPPREKQHDPDRVMPGEGHLDLKKYLALLQGTGYKRWLSLELFREDLWNQNPREVARIGLDKMRAVVEGS